MIQGVIDPNDVAVVPRTPRFLPVQSLRRELRSMYRAFDGRPWFDCLWDEGYQRLAIGRNDLNGGWTTVRILADEHGNPRQLERRDLRDVRDVVQRGRRTGHGARKVWHRGVDGQMRWMTPDVIEHFQTKDAKLRKFKEGEEWDQIRDSAKDWWNMCKGNFSMVMPGNKR